MLANKLTLSEFVIGQSAGPKHLLIRTQSVGMTQLGLRRGSLSSADRQIKCFKGDGGTDASVTLVSLGTNVEYVPSLLACLSELACL